MTNEFEHLQERGLTQEAAFWGKLVKVRVDTVALPNGEIAQREIVEHPGATAVVAIADSGDVVLVRQFRYAVNQITLEIPAGKLEHGETPEVSCHRELIEETGYEAGKLERLTEIVAAPGYTTERIVIFRASDLKKAAMHTKDADEFIDVVEVPIDEAMKMIADGRINDAKTIIGLNWVHGLNQRKA